MTRPDGGIISDQTILEAMNEGFIKIEPFDRACLGSNSYDVHLGKTLAVYGEIDWNPAERPYAHIPVIELDSARSNPITEFEIPCTCGKTPCGGNKRTCGYVLRPGSFYLGVTSEYTETRGFVPWIDGKSSGGRLSIRIHATAGRGDVGFCNHWTLEIDTILPVRVYAGMPIGQLTYFTCVGSVLTPYNQKAFAKYNQRSDRPVPSYMWKNFPKDDPACICLAGEKLDEHCPKHKVA